MTSWRRSAILVTLTALLVLLASYGELRVVAAGITIGDMTGSPPGATEAGKQAIRMLEKSGDRGFWLAIGSLIPACLLLGSELSRLFEAWLPATGRFLGYFLGLLLCPAASVALVLLMAWLR